MQLNLFLILFFSLALISNKQAGHVKPTQNRIMHNSRHLLSAIKLYPNPSYDGKISISTTKTDTLHFYIFDLEGTLINQTLLTSNEEKIVTNLSKGTYIYDVFENDESIEEGKILVR
ncbi:MAG: hypothetical protein NVS1B13_09290 [Flavisolibacter sp.]